MKHWSNYLSEKLILKHTISDLEYKQNRLIDAKANFKYAQDEFLNAERDAEILIKKNWSEDEIKVAKIKCNAVEKESVMNRQDFMDFFRNEEQLNSLTVDDRIEIFQSILLGSSDITADLLNSIINDYGVEDLEVIDTSK